MKFDECGNLTNHEVEGMVISFHEKHIPDYQPSDKNEIITEIQGIVDKNDYTGMSAYLNELANRMPGEEAVENAACDYIDIINKMEERDSQLQARVAVEIDMEESKLAHYDYQQTHPETDAPAPAIGRSEIARPPAQKGRPSLLAQLKENKQRVDRTKSTNTKQNMREI